MTSSGRLALRLDLGGILVLALVVVIVGFFDVHVLGWLGLLALVAILAAGAIALLAVLRDGERSPLVIAALLPAGFALFLLIGELAFPE